jgi:protein TonB
MTYISENLKYPEVARLVGIKGKLYVSFVVDRDGKVVNITPKNCIGAGCEAEAVKLFEASPTWQPGFQNHRAVRVQYTVPISFIMDDKPVYLEKLRSSNFGFVFKLKDSVYTIDEAWKIWGPAFSSNQVEIAVPFYNYNKAEKFVMPDKKDVYLLIFKKN